jgi:hypothetical protein
VVRRQRWIMYQATRLERSGRFPAREWRER